MKEKREFNFARRWQQAQAKQAAPTSALPLGMIAWGIGGTVIVLAIAGAPWIWEYKLAHDLVNLNRGTPALRSVEIQVQKVNELKSKIQSSQQFLDLIKKENHDPIEVLNKLKLLLPVDTVINAFSYAGDTITIAVSIPMPIDVARFWVSLRDSGIFQNVDIQSVSLVDKVQNLTLSLKYNPKANVKVPVPSTQSGAGRSAPGQASPGTATPNKQSELVQSKPNIETSVGESTPEAEHELPTPIIEVGVLEVDQPDTSAPSATAPNNNNSTSPNSAVETSPETENGTIRYPGIPKGLVATPASSSRIDLRWNSAQYASTYNVYRSTSLKGGYRKVTNVKETNYTDTGLAPGTVYYYKISSLKSTGVEGYFDNPVGTVTFDLDTPSGFKVNAGSGQIELIWNPVNGATEYKIYRSSEGGIFNLITTVAGTKYIDKDLRAGTYGYKINAIADNSKTSGTAGPVSAKLSN